LVGGGEPAMEERGVTFAELKARRIAALEMSYLEGLLKRYQGNVTWRSEEAGMVRRSAGEQVRRQPERTVL